MANSYVTHTGDGATTQFTIPFQYLDKSHIKVTVSGTPTSFNWINDSLIEISPAPAAGAPIKIYRQTSPDARLVDYQAGPFSELELDTDSLQAFYLTQEVADSVGDVVSLDPASAAFWDAKSKPIRNLPAPTDPSDAATKDYIDSQIDPKVTAAQNAQTAAETAAADSQTSANNAAISEANAATSAANAAASEANAAASAADALSATDGKVDKLAGAVVGNLPTLDGTGNIAGQIDPATLAHLAGDETFTGHKTFKEVSETVFWITSSGPLDPANGTIQRKTLTENWTFSESLTNGQSVTLMVTSRSYLIWWPAGMKWVGGSAPTLDTTLENVIVLWKAGGQLYGSYSGAV